MENWYHFCLTLSSSLHTCTYIYMWFDKEKSTTLLLWLNMCTWHVPFRIIWNSTVAQWVTLAWRKLGKILKYWIYFILARFCWNNVRLIYNCLYPLSINTINTSNSWWCIFSVIIHHNALTTNCRECFILLRSKHNDV